MILGTTKKLMDNLKSGYIDVKKVNWMNGQTPVNKKTWEHTISIYGCAIETSFDADLFSFSGGRFGEYMHSHQRYEVHIPGEDGLKIMFDGRTLELPCGMILILAPEVFHTCLPETRGRKGFSYSFKEIEAADFASPLHFKESYVVFRDNCDTIQAIRKIENAFQSAYGGSYEQAGHLVSSLLIDFARALTMENKTDGLQALHAKNSTTIIDQFFTIRYNNKFQKKTLAKMLSTSERQLERIIFITYGMTFKEKVQKTKLEMAKMLIENFAYSIPEASEIVGYDSEQSFYRAYKNYFGISPRLHQKKNKDDG